MKHIAFCLVVAALAAGCASSDKKDTPIADRSSNTTSTPTTMGQGNTTTTPTTNPNIAGNPLRDPNNVLSKRSVYFDFDSNAVKDEYRALVQAHSRYLTDKRDSRIRIEGNCDERGSREYNLALGQRRADSLKGAMKLLGVAEDQVETVSWGEEKPKANGHDESSWSQNRRSDIVYGAAR